MKALANQSWFCDLVMARIPPSRAVLQAERISPYVGSRRRLPGMPLDRSAIHATLPCSVLQSPKRRAQPLNNNPPRPRKRNYGLSYGAARRISSSKPLASPRAPGFWFQHVCIRPGSTCCSARMAGKFGRFPCKIWTLTVPSLRFLKGLSCVYSWRKIAYVTMANKLLRATHTSTQSIANENRSLALLGLLDREMSSVGTP